MRAHLLLLAALVAAAPAGAQEDVPGCQRGAPGDSVPDGGLPVYNLSEVHELPEQRGWREFQEVVARRYPPHLRSTGVSATVRVCFVLETDGWPSNAWITHSTDARFNRATLEVIHLRRFRPALLYGRPVRVWMELPIQWLAPAERRSRPG
jgi:TonB family protein